MPKKSESGKASKPNKAHKEHSSKQDHAQKSGQKERPDHGNGHQKKDREIKLPGGNDNPFDGIETLAGGKKKNGCSPKLFMMVLPFMAVGAYIFLKS